jgi:hypothetical protein
MNFDWPGGEVSLVQEVGLTDSLFNPGWDWVVYIFHLFLTCLDLDRQLAPRRASSVT